MSWQDKERERYEKKLAERWTREGNSRDIKTYEVTSGRVLRASTGTLTAGADKSDDLFALTSKMKRAQTIAFGDKLRGVARLQDAMVNQIWDSNFKEQD